MKNLKIATAVCMFIGFTTINSSCSNNSKDSKEVVEELNEEKFNNEGEKEADNLVEAYSMNLYEIMASEDAEAKSATVEVKKLAATLIKAHTKMNNDLRTLASANNISLPTELSDEQRQNLEELKALTGVDYDKEFTEEMKDKHKKAIEFYEHIEKNSHNADLRTWATNTLSEIRSHYDMVAKTADLMKERK